MNTKPLVMTILLAAVGFMLVLSLGFCALSYAATDVTLEWDSNAEADMFYYKMYRSDDDGVTWIQVGTISHVGGGAETFIDMAVSDGIYKWRVTAVDLTELESGPSNVVVETLESQPPAPPTNLWVKLKQIIAWLLNWLFGWV